MRLRRLTPLLLSFVLLTTARPAPGSEYADLLNHGFAAYKIAHFTTAQAMAKEAVALEPHRAEGYVLLAMTLAKEHRLHSAQDAIQQAGKWAPPALQPKVAAIAASIHELIRRDQAKDPQWAEAYDLTEVDQPPRVVAQVQPDYPFAQRNAGLSGQVLVDFMVARNGAVRHATAIAATDSSFAAAAVEAVAQWTFSPGMKAGQPVVVHMQVPIVFNVN